MLRTQIEDDRASSQLQAGYRECDLRQRPSLDAGF